MQEIRRAQRRLEEVLRAFKRDPGEVLCRVRPGSGPKVQVRLQQALAALVQANRRLLDAWEKALVFRYGMMGRRVLLFLLEELRSQALEGFLKRARAEPVCLALEQRLLGLDRVVDPGLDEERARYEALRCLRCDIRVKLRRVPLPPRREALKPLTPEAVAEVPAVEGVYRLYDENREILAIKGVPDLRAGLREALGHPKGKFFDYEEEPLYTQRESELLQQYLQQHGRLPGGELDELEELF